MNVCNYKEINALFALYKGVQLSQRCTNRAIGHQHYNPPTDCKNFWRKIFSHRLHGCAQIRRQKRNLKICEHL